MTEEVHIPAKAAEHLVITITPPVAQDNSTPSISERDNSYKENIDVLQTDKPQQELNDIRKDSKFFGSFFTKKNADKYKMEREIEKVKHEAEMKHHKQLSSVEQKFKSLNTQLESQITHLKNVVEEKSTCIENLKSSLAKTESEKNSFKDQLEKKSSEKISLEKENEKIKHEAEMKLHKQLSSVEQKLQLKSTCIENLESSLAKIEAEKNSFKDQLEKKSSEKERSDKDKSEEIKRLQISLTKAEAERDSQRAANKNHEALMSRISQLENSMKAKNEENLKISGDVRRIVMEHSSDLRGLHGKPTEMKIRARFPVSNLTSSKLLSPKTEVAGMNWHLTVKKENGYIGIHVYGVKKNESSKSCSAFFEVALVSQKTNDVVSRTQDDAYIFSMDGQSWGWNEFISIKDLFDEDKGYVKDDSILVYGVVKAYPTV